MVRVEPIGARVRRVLHLLVVTATAAVLALPMLLGPATTTIVRALGGANDHHCACGMAPGKCGCPECAELEHVRERTAEALRGQAILRSSCDDGAALPGYSALPFAAVPVSATLPSVAFEVRALSLAFEFDPSLERARPPTPPPRRIAV